MAKRCIQFGDACHTQYITDHEYNTTNGCISLHFVVILCSLSPYILCSLSPHIFLSHSLFVSNTPSILSIHLLCFSVFSVSIRCETQLFALIVNAIIWPLSEKSLIQTLQSHTMGRVDEIGHTIHAIIWMQQIFDDTFSQSQQHIHYRNS